MPEFVLHPRLAADCREIGRAGPAHLLLHRNAVLPWFILVPETPVADLLDLPAASRDVLLARAADVGHFLKDDLGWPRVNVGAIGHLVPQLHLHVIGRRPGDAAWPQPVWGHLRETATYNAATLADWTRRLQARGVIG